MQQIDTLGIETATNQILHPGSRKLFRHWESLRAERPCPNREELDLADISDIVPDMVIFERDHIRGSFRYRLAGTRPCQLFNENLTGKDVLGLWDTFERDVIYRHLLQSTVNFQPTLVRMRFTTDMGQDVAAELVALPFRMRGSERVQLLGGFFTFRPVHNLGHSRITKRELLAIRSIWTEFQENRSAQAERRFTVIAGGKIS